jgi:Mce-associated membrane protein
MRRPSVPLRPSLVVLAALMLLVGVLGWVRAGQLGDNASARNHAVVDRASTSAVVTAVSRGLVGVLSYSYDNPGVTEAAAQQVLTGAARKQQQTLFAQLQQKAPGQKLVLSARVEAAGVKSLEGDHATLLVFLDQSSQRATDKQATVSAAQLSVDAVRVGGTWKISGLTPL